MITYKTQYQYFGSIDYISTLIHATHIEFSSAEHHDKVLHLNRTWLYGPNNLVGLSIPLMGGRNNKQRIGAVQVADDRSWKRIHWRTLHDCYRKSPWFDEYSESLRALYESDDPHLVNWCRSTIGWVLNVLKLTNVKMADSENSAGVELLKFESAPLLQIPAGYPIYQQVFSERRGFVANLSIVDLLMNEGPLALSYLQQYAVYKKTTMNPR